MQYFGGKQKISKELSEFLNGQLKEGQPFVDLFCGSCNVVTKIDANRIRIANDKHKYLIEMWKMIQNGWIPPSEISEEEYVYIKNNRDERQYLTGFVGFGCSFSGKWFGGYARGVNGNYCDIAKRGCMKKIENAKNVLFTNLDYKDVEIPDESLVYCDIPYEGTTPYNENEIGVFNHDEFYEWVRENSNRCDIYISEYKHNVREGFEIVWEKKSNKSIRNKDGKREDTTEVLIKMKN